VSERKVAPAEGERRALRSLAAQYRVASKLVLDALFDGELEWVRLVDPEAGRLDDIVIGRPSRVDAYQVKWSDYRGQMLPPARQRQQRIRQTLPGAVHAFGRWVAQTAKCKSRQSRRPTS
jgi:hypothetical protein